ncbi:unnamed protein product, partial [Laminaria digitata]
CRTAPPRRIVRLCRALSAQKLEVRVLLAVQIQKSYEYSCQYYCFFRVLLCGRRAGAMTPPKGRRVAALPGSAPKRRKNAKNKAAAANLALMIKAQAKRIEVREAACDVRDAEAAQRVEQQSKKAAKREEQQSKKGENQEQQRVVLSASLTAREVALERREVAFEQRMKEEALAKATTPQRQARQEAAAAVRDDLAHARGALLDASQSRDILLLYYGLVQSGME